MNDYIQLVFGNPVVILNHGRCVIPVEIGVGGAVIVIFYKIAVVSRNNLVAAECIVYVAWLVVGRSNGNDGTFANEERDAIQWCVVAVEDAATLNKSSGVGVEPFGTTDVIIPVRQIDAIADVISIGVHLRVLIDGSDEEVRAVHELILRQVVNLLAVFKRSIESHACPAIMLDIVGHLVLFPRHRPHHRNSPTCCFPRDAVGVGHKGGFELQPRAVDVLRPFAEGMGVFLVGTPAVHVQLHGGEGLPLEVAHVHGEVPPAEDAVHIATHVGLAGEARADVGGDMEADVLPLPAHLVAAPKAGIALGACPAVERNNKRTRAIALLGHNLCHVGHAVEAEAVAGAHPGNVGLEHTHAGIAHFAHDVALEQRLNALLRMEVRLRPKANLHATLAGVVAKLTQVVDVPCQRARLAIACAIAVVGQHPAERHVVGGIAIHYRTGGELVVASSEGVRQFAVKALADASGHRFLALAVALAVLKGDAALAVHLRPVVAVVGVEVAFVEAELGQQHGHARQLIIAIYR